jgi:hypothetical protein
MRGIPAQEVILVDEEQVRRHVVTRLAQGIHPRDIILTLCETYGMNWPDAEALVGEIAASATGEVARRRFPLFAILALGIIAGGLALIASFIVTVIFPFTLAGPEGANRTIAQAGSLLGWLMLNLEGVGQALLGAAMVVGGAVGLHRVMRETLEM